MCRATINWVSLETLSSLVLREVSASIFCGENAHTAKSVASALSRKERVLGVAIAYAATSTRRPSVLAHKRARGRCPDLISEALPLLVTFGHALWVECGFHDCSSDAKAVFVAMHLDECVHEVVMFSTVIVYSEAVGTKVREVEHDGMTTQSFSALVLQIIY